MNIWIELSTVLVEVFLPWYFFSGMLGRTSRPFLLKTAVGLIYAATLAALSLRLISSPFRSTAIIILTFLSAKVYFGKDWLATLYPTILFFLFAILADILCGILLQAGGVPASELMGDGIDRLIYNIFCKLLHLLFLYLALAIIKGKFDTYSILRALPLLSCQILSIYICQRNFLTIMEGSGMDFLCFETLGLLYINLIMCAFVETLNRSHEREQEERTARQQLELQESYYLDVMERQEETRRLWHDIKKYMASIESLVANENQEEAQKCLEQIQFAFCGIANAVDTGNKLVDSIFTYGMKKANELDVTIRPDIWVDSQMHFPATDMFVIIGNTLDNAIEACCQIEDKSARVVSVILHQKNHLLLYEVSNPYNGKKLQGPGKVHGYGLKNVEACVERNDGIMNIAKEHSTFVVSIQLNLEG